MDLFAHTRASLNPTDATRLRIGRFVSGDPLAVRDSSGGRGEHPRGPSPLRGIPPSSGDMPPHWLEHGVRRSRFAHWLKATRLARPWSGANASVANGTPPTGTRHVCASERPMVEGSQGGCRCCWWCKNPNYKITRSALTLNSH